MHAPKLAACCSVHVMLCVGCHARCARCDGLQVQAAYRASGATYVLGQSKLVTANRKAWLKVTHPFLGSIRLRLCNVLGREM